MKAPDTFKKTVIAVEGLRFDALTEGPVDGELVLFLHGFPEVADAWLNVMHPIAQTGFYCVAVNQRGYAREARPEYVRDYVIQHLISDVQGFGDALSRQRFHLVGHDWGAFVAWEFAAKHADRLQSLSTLSTPHPDAFFNAIESDEDQKQRSRYIGVFRRPAEWLKVYSRAMTTSAFEAYTKGSFPNLRLVRTSVGLRNPAPLLQS